MRLSMISAAMVAALVGYGSTIALVLSAASALGASPSQTASWVMAISLAKAVGTLALSTWLRIPVILAWSTGGAALIAATNGITMNQAAAAFFVAGLLYALTGLVKPLGRLIAAIPDGIAGGMLAGILLPFCLAGVRAIDTAPMIVLPMIAVFAFVRLLNPSMAVLAAMAIGIFITFAFGFAEAPHLTFDIPMLEFVAPEWNMGAIIGLGLPLYLVTMASQNLPGFATQRSAGYKPNVPPSLAMTGALSAGIGLFGSHSVSMAAITAAVCMGPDVHPDKGERWKVALPYAAIWTILALSSPMLLSLLAALPQEFMTILVALALLGALTGALTTGFAVPEQRFSTVVTLVVTASGLPIMGIGAAFWGLLAGIAFYTAERLWARRLSKG